MRFKINRQSIVAIVTIVFISYILYVGLSILMYSKVDEMTKADAAIVLGAGTWGYDPSPVFEGRINHGIWLYKNGYVKKIIFTGGRGKNNRYSDSSIAKKYALEKGVQLKDVFIEELSAITQDNIFYASKIVKDNNMSDVIIVSDPLHMKRAMVMAKDCGLKAHSSPTPTTRYNSFRSRAQFLIREIFFYMGYDLYRLFRG